MINNNNNDDELQTLDQIIKQLTLKDLDEIKSACCHAFLTAHDNIILLLNRFKEVNYLPKEETITDLLLLEIKEQLIANNVQNYANVLPTTRHEENSNGADFICEFEYKDDDDGEINCFSVLVQAKKNKERPSNEDIQFKKMCKLWGSGERMFKIPFWVNYDTEKIAIQCWTQGMILNEKKNQMPVHFAELPRLFDVINNEYETDEEVEHWYSYIGCEHKPESVEVKGEKAIWNLGERKLMTKVKNNNTFSIFSHSLFK